MNVTPQERQALEDLLDAVDAEAPERFEALLASRPREGVLFGLFEELGLGDVEVAVVLVALALRLDGRVAIAGSQLAARAATRSAARLAALGALAPSGRLLRRGLVQVEPSHDAGAGAADTPFRLGAPLFDRAARVFQHHDDEPEPEEPRPYVSNTDLLGDLRRLSQVYRRRAARLFHLDPWAGAGLDSVDGTRELVDRAREDGEQVRRRLALTPRRSSLACLALMREHDLSLDEVVILVTVLFQELIEGVGAVDAVDLVKLICENEAELVRRRHALRRLEQLDLLRLEGAYAGKDLTADASLPESAIDKLLGELGEIDSDERLDFHAWLRDLDSSDGFFDGLGGGL